MTRVLSGVVLAAAALAAILYVPPVALQILVALVAGAAAFEYLGLIGMSDRRGIHVGYIAVVGVTAWLVSQAGAALVPWIMLLVAGTQTVFIKRHTAQQHILSAFAVLYIGMPMGMLAILNINHGWRATVLLIATVVVSDSLQFYTGRMFGRHPLAPAISPIWCAPSKYSFPPHSASASLISSRGNGNSVIDVPSATSFGRASAAVLRNKSRSTVNSCGSIGTSTIFRPRTPAGPSGRLLEWPPNGWAMLMITSPGSVRAV